MDISEINDKIYTLWNKYPNDRNSLAPIFIDKIPSGKLLFIGLNPAFNVKWIGKRLKLNKHAVSNPIEFFKWNPEEDKDKYIDRLLHNDKIPSSEIYSYYSKFRAIASDLCTTWSDVDLFFYRESKQKIFERIIRVGDDLNEFGMAQFRISGRLIRLSKPKVMIFANALSSSIFKKNYKEVGFDSLQFDDSRGYHWLECESKKIPVFFSGMLTGQRALDTGSYERLKWHIKQALLKS